MASGKRHQIRVFVGKEKSNPEYLDMDINV
jgi:hypothetical protein